MLLEITRMPHHLAEGLSILKNYFSPNTAKEWNKLCIKIKA